MNLTQTPIGRIVKIDGIVISIEISPDEQLQNVSFSWDTKDYLVSIHRYIYCFLPDKRRIISRITTIFDKDLFSDRSLFDKKSYKYIVEANLTAIFDDFTGKIDTGINTFPIIGSDIYSLPNDIYLKMLVNTSPYKLGVGESFQGSDITIQANPDILFGKHLAVFGNTGTGKSCTVASIIQGLKRRLNSPPSSIKTKIVIFDANNEYESAFLAPEYSVRKISRTDLRIPYSTLSNSEIVRLFDASQGVQAPTLVEALQLCPSSFREINTKIRDVIRRKSNNNDYSYNQWYGWNSTMMNRIQRLADNETLMGCIDTTENTLESVFDGEHEIVIIDLDFDKYELDIVTFLLCKQLYKQVVSRPETDHSSLVLVLEEAHRYINESEAEEYKLGNYYIERIAREGRKFGLSLIVSSQRPSELSKSVVSQCNSFIIHRITNRNDYDFLFRILSSSNMELLKAIPGLERQYAVVTGEAFTFSDIVKIAKADPIPDSNDPQVIASWIERRTPRAYQ